MGRLKLILVAVMILSVTLSAPPIRGEAYALRGLDKGDQAKDYELEIADGSRKRLSECAKEKGVMVIFWATWSERSKQLLAHVKENLYEKYSEKGIGFIAINVDHQDLTGEERELIKEEYGKMGMPFPTAIDSDLTIFDEFGVIANPSTVLLSRDLKVVDAYPGFGSMAKEEIPNILNAHLGIKEKKKPESVQYLLSKKPKNNALLYYNLGKTLYRRYLSKDGKLKRAPSSVIGKLDTASKRDPDFYAPYMLKAIIYNKVGDVAARDEVLKTIEEKGFSEFVERRSLAYMYFLLSMTDRSREIVEVLKKEIPDEPVVRLLDAMLAHLEGKEEARVLFKGLIGVTLPFDIQGKVDPETGELLPKGEEAKTLNYFAEKVLGIAK